MSGAFLTRAKARSEAIGRQGADNEGRQQLPTTPAAIRAGYLRCNRIRACPPVLRRCRSLLPATATDMLPIGAGRNPVARRAVGAQFNRPKGTTQGSPGQRLGSKGERVIRKTQGWNGQPARPGGLPARPISSGHHTNAYRLRALRNRRQVAAADSQVGCSTRTSTLVIAAGVL